MRDLAKLLIPDVILSRVRAQRVRYNRRSIVRVSAREPVVLIPDNNVEHYYHFVFDLALPLFLLLEHAGSQTTFVVKTSGPFLSRLERLFPDRLILSNGPERTTGVEHILLGMNPIFVAVTARELLAFSRHVRTSFGVAPAGTPRKVLLIERLETQEFFAKAARKRGGGASRRHIPNHGELADDLSSIVRSPFEFVNVQLEQMSFREQIRVFGDAVVVVGQHGAGLANTLWMAAGGNVIELSNDPAMPHFRTLSRILDHQYFCHRTVGPHTPIEVHRLIGELQRDERFTEFFGRV